MENFKLQIELIPKTSWYNNLRSNLKKSDWDKLRKEAYENCNHKCFICGSEPKILDAHELWEFDDVNNIQKLVKIIALCKSCHGVIHFGHTQLRGYGNDAINHFMKVNECDFEDFEEHKDKAFEIWQKRSQVEWKVDMTLITDRGFVLIEK